MIFSYLVFEIHDFTFIVSFLPRRSCSVTYCVLSPPPLKINQHSHVHLLAEIIHICSINISTSWILLSHFSSNFVIQNSRFSHCLYKSVRTVIPHINVIWLSFIFYWFFLLHSSIDILFLSFQQYILPRTLNVFTHPIQPS